LCSRDDYAYTFVDLNTGVHVPTNVMIITSFPDDYSGRTACWTDRDSVLVACGHECMVTEISSRGDVLNVFEVDMPMGPVAYGFGRIAVATCSSDERFKRVAILDYDTGMVMGNFGNYGIHEGVLDSITAIRFLDKDHVVTAGSQPWASVFTIDGKFVKCIGKGLTFGSDIEVIDQGRTVLALDATDPTRINRINVRSGALEGSVCCDSADGFLSLNTHFHQVMAYDATRSRVFFYE
jgi:hypothetical protein